MGKINVLEKHVAELIAAGEVVERPASVIKEIIENSIDAGATSVTVEISRGAASYMRVTDNGSGIMRDDVRTAFKRHATSKIREQDDLDNILTLGFRGEALASICAVAKVSLLTKTKDEEFGTRYIIEGGEEILFEEAGCPNGTTIIIRDIFYNTPARMKFLKKDVTEANAVAAVVDKAALSHPEVAFSFIRDGKTVLSTSGDGDLKKTVYSVFGKDLAESLIPVSYELSGVKVSGYVSKPVYSRPNRSMQHFFINGRIIKSTTAAVALEEAYKGSIMVGKFPACFLHLNIPAQTVDVNVHPAKIEVRFVNERPIFDAVYHAVKSAITKKDTIKEIKLPEKKVLTNPIYKEAPKQFKLEEKSAEKPVVKKVETPAPVKQESVKIKTLEEIFGFTSKKESFVFNDTPRVLREEKVTVPAVIEEVTEEVPEEKEPEIIVKEELKEEKSLDLPIKIICEVFDTYIVAQYGEDKLMLIDKHAAHERLLYEKLKKSEKVHSQNLLSPISVVLNKQDYSAIIENTEILLKAGYEIEDFGMGSVLVRSVPLGIEADEAEDQITEIAGYLVLNKTDITTEKLDWLCHNIACRSAVKAGNKSDISELLALAKELYENPEVRYCPHGRPVYTVLTKYELDKQFGRV